MKIIRWILLFLALLMSIVLATPALVGSGTDIDVIVVPVLVEAMPSVESSNATDIDGTYATLHGNITATGGGTVTIRGFQWGYSAGNYSANWTEGGSFGVGKFSHGITGLTPVSEVFWRALATNVLGTNYSVERSFNTTLPLPGAPMNLTTTQTGNSSLNATWTKGPYASYTILRIKVDEYPEDITDGEELYYGEDENVSFNLTYFGVDSMDMELYNLDNRVYCIRAWSQNERGYSSDYAQARLGAAEIASIIFVLGLCVFALWKTAWIRTLLSICIIMWGVSALPNDYKIAVPLIVMGAVLFIASVISHWRDKTYRTLKEVD